MPIMLDNLSQQTAQTSIKKTYSPKFFDKELTGVGKKTGLLNDIINPASVHLAMSNNPNYHIVSSINSNSKNRHHQYTNGNTTTHQIPLSVFHPNVLEYMNMVDASIIIPDNLCNIGSIVRHNMKQADVYFKLEPTHICIEKVKNTPQADNTTSVSTTKTTTVTYNAQAYIVCDPNNKKAIVEKSTTKDQLDDSYIHYNDNIMLYCNTIKPGEVIDKLATSISNLQLDVNAINDYFDHYSLYDAVCKQSEEWQSTINEKYDMLFDAFPITALNQNHNDEYVICETLRYLENYAIPLDIYRKIYESISKKYPTEVANYMCKQNLNLLLSNTLNELNNNKASLSPIPTCSAGINTLTGKKFSSEQQRAIATQSPLSLVQAGAGTGKSTVILGRIDWMIASGVKPEDIMVLSFTNAAADNIIERNPNVHSMTIAKMIHTIYTANYPNHELSTMETIVNSLDIYFPSDDTARKLAYLCKEINKNARHSFTAINNFIEENFDAVINLLNTIGQTSLELEIIICYQNIENLVEPPEVLSRHLIIDEVQDNSVFEFIYTLKYVNKHKESLFIVGDCSQTLYEFRASDPRALNVLEASGVFDAYQLQVNYRSNQEILDFANVTLANIEANQYANIRLRANSLQQVTEQSFTDKVRMKYYRLKNITDFIKTIPTMVSRDLKAYVDECFARGEQVAFLAYERFTINNFQEEIKKIWPNKTIVNLVPNVPRDNIILSTFIKNHWDEVQFLPTKNITDTIIRTCLDSLVANARGSITTQAKQQKIATEILLEWQQKVCHNVTRMQTAFGNGLITFDEFMNNVKKSMLDFEIQRNTIRQALVSQRNRENKQQNNAKNADFILSTIHSAKGLEFDNCVVIYRNDRTNEDEKRMHYVALTRAMKSEFIIAYDKVAKPAIETAYLDIVNMLHKIAPKNSNSDMIAKARAFLSANNKHQCESIEGVPSYDLPLVNNTILKPIVYSTHKLEPKINKIGIIYGRLFTHVDDIQTMINIAQNIINNANTRAETIENKEDDDENSEMKDKTISA